MSTQTQVQVQSVIDSTTICNDKECEAKQDESDSILKAVQAMIPPFVRDNKNSLVDYGKLHQAIGSKPITRSTDYDGPTQDEYEDIVGIVIDLLLKIEYLPEVAKSTSLNEELIENAKELACLLEEQTINSSTDLLLRQFSKIEPYCFLIPSLRSYLELDILNDQSFIRIMAELKDQLDPQYHSIIDKCITFIHTPAGEDIDTTKNFPGVEFIEIMEKVPEKLWLAISDCAQYMGNSLTIDDYYSDADDSTESE